ncbi:MAG: MFS transporter [Steroidobacteraceae bacterium]
MTNHSASALDALRHGQFMRYAAARFLATLSWQMIGVAVGWQVYARTGNPLDLGWVGLAQFLPFFLAILPAGFVVDRVNRRNVLIAAYCIEASCAVALLVFTLLDVADVRLIFAAMALFGLGRAFWMPAGHAIVPNLVPVPLFPSAVAANSVLFQTGVIIGPALGGLLYLAGPAVVYAFILCLLALVVLLMAGIRLPPAGAAAITSSLAEVLEGLRFVLRKRILLGAISLDLFAVLFGGATALLPVLARDVLQVGPAGLGLLRTAPGLGAALIAALIALRPIRRHAGRWMFGGIGAFAVATIVLGLSSWFWLSLLALVVLGGGDMVSVYVRSVLVQLETPDHIRGRVSAVSSMFIGASNELGEFESGVTASWWGAVRAIVIGGVLCLGVVVIYARLFPELRRMDRLLERSDDALPARPSS